MRGGVAPLQASSASTQHQQPSPSTQHRSSDEKRRLDKDNQPSPLDELLSNIPLHATYTNTATNFPRIAIGPFIATTKAKAFVSSTTGATWHLGFDPGTGTLTLGDGKVNIYETQVYSTSGRAAHLANDVVTVVDKFHTGWQNLNLNTPAYDISATRSGVLVTPPALGPPHLAINFGSKDITITASDNQSFNNPGRLGTTNIGLTVTLTLTPRLVAPPPEARPERTPVTAPQPALSPYQQFLSYQHRPTTSLAQLERIGGDINRAQHEAALSVIHALESFASSFAGSGNSAGGPFSRLANEIDEAFVDL